MSPSNRNQTSLKILIVEDQFIEANDLQIILEKAGHIVCGIAKSVPAALDYLKTDKPEIVLLDIFLKGSQSGIDLAPTLTKNNIPFIFVSANSDPKTFDAAKATRPDGFLIKPFRELDILVALDIATYRHKHATEQIHHQGRWLSNMLNQIIESTKSFEEKLSLLIKSFKPFIPFDHVVIDLDTTNNGTESKHSFHRISFDEYEYSSAEKLIKEFNITRQELATLNKKSSKSLEMLSLTQQDFIDFSLSDLMALKIRETYGVKSLLEVPVYGNLGSHMTVSFYSCEPVAYSKEHLELLSPLLDQLGTAMTSLTQTSSKHQREITKTNGSKRTEGDCEFNQIIGKSPKLLQALDLVHQVAPMDISVLILGETGVGKEGLAKAIHYLSKRKSKPLVKVNCGAIPPTLMESELFGHEKGAFSGAYERRIGKFEQAQGGTIFLDEIGEMPLETQTKLLRVIQEKELERIGGRATIKLDIRIITATNRNLYREVAAGKFRIDLYYRINVFSITLAPLRERTEDIPCLVDYFLRKHAKIAKNQTKKIGQQAMETLLRYSWPGNIRELENVIERQIILTPSGVISFIDLPEEEMPQGDQSHGVHFKSSPDNEKKDILTALTKSNGKVSGKGGAAEILDMPAATLVSKMKKLGINWSYVS